MEGERKLATVRQVGEVLPIIGADAIELIKFKEVTWQCVSKISEFKPGDYAVYFEIDSLLPCVEPFMFLESRGRKKIATGEEGYRLKTIKLKGTLSQGLALPIKAFPNIHHDCFMGPLEGFDVTETLGIKKWEAPISAQLMGMAKGNFPGWLHKSDQERIQNLKHLLETHADRDFEVTIKMDGSSGSFYLKDDVFGVCSRNLDLKETEGNTYWKVARELKLEERLRRFKEEFGRNLMIQGEIVGEGIQKNRDNIKGHRLFVFDIWDIDAGHYVLPHTRYEYMAKLGLSKDDHHVPVLEWKKLKSFNSVQEILEYAEGPGYNSPNREGVVFKCTIREDEIGITTFKAISNKYLLKYEE